MVKRDGEVGGAPGRGARTRAAIVAAARHRFAEGGFDGTAVARIAADAGVSEPTVAFHFGSKAGLLIAVMAAYYDDVVRRLDEVVDPAAPPLGRMRAFTSFWLTHNAEHFRLIEVFGRQGRRSDADEVVAALVANNRRVTAVLDRLVEDAKHAGAVRPDVPTRILRDAFFGTAEHLLIGRALTGRPADLDQAAAELLDLLLHGAGVPIATTGPSVATLDAKLDRLLARVEGNTA